MIKVLQINTVYKNGGSTGRIVYDLKSIGENNDVCRLWLRIFKVTRGRLYKNKEVRRNSGT